MPEPAPAFRERVLPGPGGWSAAVGFAVVLGVALWPVDDVLSLSATLVALVVLVGLLWWTSPVVSVGPGPDGTQVLRAGRATIPVALLADAVALDRSAMTAALGPTLDARAYVCLRAWARTGARISLDDPADPTPYWLVSTRRPAALVAALAAGGATSPSDPRPGSGTLDA
jgi:hypothetical protein